jgi:DNA-binding beta-propeller fold protein YncE
MAMEKKGTLLVADRGNNRIVRFNREGKFLGSWGRPGRRRGELGQPWDVAVGADGRVYCLDSWNNRVQVIEW